MTAQKNEPLQGRIFFQTDLNYVLGAGNVDQVIGLRITGFGYAGNVHHRIYLPQLTLKSLLPGNFPVAELQSQVLDPAEVALFSHQTDHLMTKP